MAITKTDFINYSRCPRYIILDKIKKDKFLSDISISEYKNIEKNEYIEEMLSSMYDEVDGEEVDLVDVKNKQLEAMLKYYNQVEIEAGRLTEKYFKGTSKYSLETYNQECFDFNQNGIRYKCFVDVYNENENINIIEVKATTTNKFKKLGYKNKEKEFISIFEKSGPFWLLKEDVLSELEFSKINKDLYDKQIAKLYDRYSDCGKYVYDLAVQRFIIEGEYKESNNFDKSKDIKYYLAVLNADYVFDGTYENGVAKYEIDKNDNELITFIDLTSVTLNMQDMIKNNARKIEDIIFDPVDKVCDLGKHCGYKKQNCCKFFNAICGKDIPKKNSSLNYLTNPGGFIINDVRIKGLDLINNGYFNMLDIPNEAIIRKTHNIQRECLLFNKTYINKEKLKLGLAELKYPIYHLDFETFPCPLPRFKGEWPYIQSTFEFSLHIENEPGVCDKEKDNYVFLAKTHDDEREELCKKLVELIDGDKGTLFAQNVPFEKARIKELAHIFPEYKEKLMKIYDRGFDLLWLVNTNSNLYQSLGYSEEDAKVFNFYHPDLSGSFSIKKTLPVFSDLSYSKLIVKNGTDAIVEYANYPYMTKEEYNIKYDALVEYCKQDTWAMVVILDELRKLVK